MRDVGCEFANRHKNRNWQEADQERIVRKLVNINPGLKVKEVLTFLG